MNCNAICFFLPSKKKVYLASSSSSLSLFSSSSFKNKFMKKKIVNELKLDEFKETVIIISIISYC